MSWTAFKKELRVGAVIKVYNLRRPWRTRVVEIVSKSKRTIVVKDEHGEHTKLPLPAAAMTRMTEMGDSPAAELLADADGPAFHAETQEKIGTILAGTPYMAVQLMKRGE